MTVDSGVVLSELTPWTGYRTFAREEKSRPLLELVDMGIRPKIAEVLIERFQQVGGVQQLLSNDFIGEKFILLEKEGCLWTGVSREKLIRIFQAAPSTSEVRNNLVWFIHLLDHELTRGVDGPFKEGALWIVHQQDILEAVWRGVFSVPLNPRLLGSCRQIRDRWEEKLKVSIEMPKWASSEAEAC